MSSDIIRMAREANLPSCLATHPVALERFATLVAKEAERVASFDKAELWLKRINDAVLAEKEACAKVCEDSQAPADWDRVAVLWKECKNKLAAAIRARGQA
jgi:hypothetical protein